MDEPYVKVLVCGNVIEVYDYEKTPYQLKSLCSKKNPSAEWIKEMIEEQKKIDNYKTKDEMEEAFKKAFLQRGLDGAFDFVRKHNRRLSTNVTRTRNMVRRLALANFKPKKDKFVTFTFADDVKDVEQANGYWKRFIQRLRRRYGDFKYLAVIEFMKNGKVHYHALMTLPYVPKSHLAEIWGNGFVKINMVKHVDNIGAYIVKYMTKDLMDERLCGKKAYQCSKGLVRPSIYRGKEAEAIISAYDLNNKKAVFANRYESEYLGNANYREFNLDRL